MMSKLEGMVKTLEDLQKEVKGDSSGDSSDDKPGYSSSPKNPASNCESIRQHEPLKRNGYYWVKMPCMPEPARVYCDFDNNYPNFYLYKGYPYEKKQIMENTDNPEGIRKICGEIGLEPAELKSEGAFLKMLEYLEHSGSSSEDDFAIPFAHKYEPGEEAKWKSLNDKESSDNFDTFKKHIKKPFIEMLGAGDTYVQIGVRR